MDFNGFFKSIFHKKDEKILSSPGTEITETKPVTETAKPEPPVVKPEPVVVNEPEKPKKYAGKNFYVLLDNGHAKSTPGKRSPLLADGNRFYEWEFNRDIVSRIAEGLDALGIKYHILVPEVEKDVALSERANRANEYCKKYGTKNCMMISVHSNALGNGNDWQSAGKWSVWTTVGVTKSDEYGKVIYKVAEEMLAKYGFGCRDGKVQGNGNAGPDYEENFTVLYKTWCPAILTENLFYTNKKECEWLMTTTGRRVIADIHIEAIRRIADTF